MLDRAVDRAVAALRGLPTLPDTSQVVHAAALAALRDAGFVVKPEVTVVLPEGRNGRYDLVAEWGSHRIAVEIDTRKPRQKSLDKLRAFDGGRIIALRGVSCAWRIDGIDAIVPLKVRIASSPEVSDKKVVKRTHKMEVR